MSTRTALTNLSIRSLKLPVFALAGVGFLALSVPAFSEPMLFWTGIILGGYIYPTHELHHFVLGSVFGLLLLGVVAQAVQPAKRVGALHSSLIIWGLFSIVFTIGSGFSPVFIILLGLLTVMAIVHPAGRSQLPSVETLDRRMAAMAAVTTVGAIAFATNQLLSQLSLTDAHAGFEHYLFMATAALAIGALSIHASFRGTGWRFPAYAAAFFMLVIGVGSIVYPGAEQGSSLGVALGFVVALWAVLFISIAERGDELMAAIGR